LSYRDQQCFNLREGCLLRAASKDDFDGRWKTVNFDGTESPVEIKHDLALAYAQSAVRNMVFDTPEPDEFDKETAEAWLGIGKKERKNLAKKMHPTQALARKRNKQAPADEAKPTTETEPHK
jgi:hypothetical protein